MDRVEVEDMGVVMFQFITMIAYSKARCGGVLGTFGEDTFFFLEWNQIGFESRNS